MSQHTGSAQHDGLGVGTREREIGRYSARRPGSRMPGTTLVIVAGVHGNEPAGWNAAQRVIDTLHEEQPTGFDGSIVALLGNLAAINHPNPDTRYVAHDLNRLFTDEQIALPPETSPEHAQVQELFASLRSIRAHCERMVVVDLHTTSADAPPMVVMEDSIPTRRLARKLPLPIYLGFEEELGGLLMDRTTNELGAISLVVEGGQHRDPKAVDVHEAVIWSVLDASGILPLDALPHERSPGVLLNRRVGPERGMVFDIRYRYPIAHPDFRICPDITHGSRVRREITPIATENGSVVTSPIAGLVFMPNMQPLKRPGDDGFFIVRRVGEGWLGLSERLRRQRWMQWLFSHLPGVYICDEQTLCIDADLAAVMRRQILHLMGYRILRYDHRHGGHGIRRIYKGLVAFTRALLRGPIPGGPDINDPRFWIVRRHALDE